MLPDLKGVLALSRGLDGVCAERERFEVRRYAWRPHLVKLYDEARTYVDGKWLTIPIGSAEDLHDLTQLLTMKRRPTIRMKPADRPGSADHNMKETLQ